MRRVLVIEDEPDMLEMLSLLLESAGYMVTQSQYGDAAIRALEKETHDLVLADLLVDSRHVEDAWKTIDRIVNIAGAAPVGLMTGWTVTPAEAEGHGISFVLRKPAQRGALFAELAKALQLPDLSEERANMLRSYFAAIESGDYGTLASLCTGDVVYRQPGDDPRFANEIHGAAAFVAFTRDTFESTFRHPRFEVTSMRPLPSGAIVEYVGSWRDGNETRHMPGAIMFEVRGGLLGRIDVRVAVEELR